MSRCLLLCFVLITASRPCWSQWRLHPELPRWAQRGRLHWCLHYARIDRRLVDLFVDGRQTLVHGGYFDNDATATYARQRGLRYMPYVCSRTVTTREIAKAPQLKQAVVLRPDGSEFLAYNNPVRRYGSLFAPAWPAYARTRMGRVWNRPDVAAVFFDNAFWPGDDHRPLAIRAWQAWAVRHGLKPGDDVPSIYRGPLAAASRAFASESLTRYHAALRRLCHKHTPLLLNCPNAGNAYGLAAAEAGAIDLFFYETMTHPPFANNAFRYKAGLAATHGKPTALLAYLPPRIAAQRGVRTWNEGMHHYFYPSSPLPEEIALAAAEGAACGGTYVVNYHLFPSLPITDTTDPFCRRIHRAIRQAYTFINANEDLYSDAQPGSDVAILYSTATDIQNRRLQNVHALGQALTDAGIPYEVVVPSDLPDEMAGVRTLVLPNVAYVAEATAEGALRFVRRGGRVLVTGDYAVYDPIGRPAQWPAAAQLLAPLHLIARAVREWRLDGFEPEGAAQVRVRSRVGTASLRFDGTAGRYVAHICILDENDGASTFTFRVGDKDVYKAALDAEDNRRHWFTTSAFDLSPGQVVALTVCADAGERGRVQSIVLAGAESGRGAALGRGRVLYSPLSLQRLSPAQRLALLRPSALLPQPGKLFVNVMNLPTRGLRTVHLVNYDFRYEVTRPGLFASDDGESDARMFFGAEPVVVRKRIRIPDPPKVWQPVVQVHGFATRACAGRLAIAVNGQRVGEIEAANMHGSGWREIAIDKRLLRTDNLIEIRGEGELDGMAKWIQIDIDADAHARNSWFSTDRGATFAQDDLSTDRKPQTGEYMIRILDKAPGEGPHDPANVVRNPGFERSHTAHSETKLAVAPARNVAVCVADAQPAACLAISPDGPPAWVTGVARGDKTIYRAPEVRIYTVLLLARSRRDLGPWREAQMKAAGWTLPPVTEPLRESVVNWSAYGQGFAPETGAAHGGAKCARCENADAGQVRGAAQTLKFDKNPPRRLIITAWSRCERVSGRRDAHYSVYVDAVCSDNTVFNGRHASFATGTHGWQQATLHLRPPAAIRTMRLYLLFRKHKGVAWFDDVTMKAE